MRLGIYSPAMLSGQTEYVSPLDNVKILPTWHVVSEWQMYVLLCLVLQKVESVGALIRFTSIATVIKSRNRQFGIIILRPKPIHGFWNTCSFWK